MTKAILAGLLLFVTASLVSAQGAGTFQLDLPLGNRVGEPLPCPPGIACENYALVRISRVGGATGAVTVDLRVTGGTATLFTDYDLAPVGTGPTDGATFRFPDGNSTPQSLFIVPRADGIAEGDETVVVTLSNATGGAAIGTPNNETVTIFDTFAAPSQIPAVGAGGLLSLALAVGAAGAFLLARRTS